MEDIYVTTLARLRMCKPQISGQLATQGGREMRRLGACVLVESVRGFTRKPREVVKLSSRMPEPIDAAAAAVAAAATTAVAFRLLSPYPRCAPLSRQPA